MLELSDLLMADLASPLRERWEGFNKLRHTAQGQVLRLDWQDRAIMLRSTCEWALNSSPYVRGQISSHYNLLPQRVVRRRPEENPLIIAPIGRDRNRNPYFRLDDTPRIYRAGSFYNANNYWEPITETAEDVARLATSFDAAASTGKKAAGNTKTPELERAFKKHLQTEVIPNLGLSEERLRMLSRTYNEWIKAEQRAARQERAHVEQSVEPEPLPVADDISAASANGSRRAAAKRINYKGESFCCGE